MANWELAINGKCFKMNTSNNSESQSYKCSTTKNIHYTTFDNGRQRFLM